MKFLALCSLVLTLCLIFISESNLSTNARVHGHHAPLGDGPDLIGQICSQLISPEDKINCTNILKSDHRILLAKNWLEFSVASLKLGVDKGIKGQNFLKELVKEKYNQAIEECANFCYDEVVTSFRVALTSVKDDPMSANYSAKIAGDGPTTCERGLAAAHIVNPLISALNNEISLVSYIAFEATLRL